MMSEDQRLAHQRAVVALYCLLIGRHWPDQRDVLPPIHDDPLWQHLTKYVCGCGFASALSHPQLLQEMRGIAPAHFIEALQKRSRADALRELSHRETLQRLHDALSQTGNRAILLKGAAFYMLEQSTGNPPGRIPGDIDIWLTCPAAASAFRAHLRDNGFTGDKNAAQTAPHHLAPVTWRHSAVEIHTAPMPSFWGLPGDDFAERAAPVRDWPCFQTLSPTDMVLHEAVHCTSHLWSFGMKLAWDLQRISGLPGEVHWDALPQLAEQTQFPAAFWTPLCALAGAQPPVALPLPQNFLGALQQGTNNRNSKRLASARMFTSTDNADALNPLLRNLIFLDLMPWQKRASYIAYLFSKEAAESRRVALGTHGGQSWRRLPGHLVQAWHQWRAMR